MWAALNKVALVVLGASALAALLMLLLLLYGVRKLNE